MPILGQARAYHQKHRFQVQIDNIAYGSFQSCTELSSEFAEITQWEGGTNIAHKTAGRQTFDDVTLARGVTGDLALYDWHLQLGDAVDNTGLNEPQYKRNVEVVQCDSAGGQLRRWRLVGAWPKKYVAGDWDNDADENVIEQLTLAFDYFELVGGPRVAVMGAIRVT
jgi:phage tail-like protein